MNADVSGNAVHLDICDRSFQRFLIKVQFLDIDMIVFEGFPDVILTAQIVRTMPFKFVYKSKCLFIRALKDKVDVIGHQNESKDNHSCAYAMSGMAFMAALKSSWFLNQILASR